MRETETRERGRARKGAGRAGRGGAGRGEAGRGEAGWGVYFLFSGSRKAVILVCSSSAVLVFCRGRSRGDCRLHLHLLGFPTFHPRDAATVSACSFSTATELLSTQSLLCHPQRSICGRRHLTGGCGHV